MKTLFKKTAEEKFSLLGVNRLIYFSKDLKKDELLGEDFNLENNDWDNLLNTKGDDSDLNLGETRDEIDSLLGSSDEIDDFDEDFEINTSISDASPFSIQASDVTDFQNVPIQNKRNQTSLEKFLESEDLTVWTILSENNHSKEEKKSIWGKVKAFFSWWKKEKAEIKTEKSQTTQAEFLESEYEDLYEEANSLPAEDLQFPEEESIGFGDLGWENLSFSEITKKPEQVKKTSPNLDFDLGEEDEEPLVEEIEEMEALVGGNLDDLAKKENIPLKKDWEKNEDSLDKWDYTQWIQGLDLDDNEEVSEEEIAEMEPLAVEKLGNDSRKPTEPKTQDSTEDELDLDAWAQELDLDDDKNVLENIPEEIKALPIPNIEEIEIAPKKLVFDSAEKIAFAKKEDIPKTEKSLQISSKSNSIQTSSEYNQKAGEAFQAMRKTVKDSPEYENLYNQWIDFLARVKQATAKEQLEGEIQSIESYIPIAQDLQVKGETVEVRQGLQMALQSYQEQIRAKKIAIEKIIAKPLEDFYGKNVWQRKIDKIKKEIQELDYTARNGEEITKRYGKFLEPQEGYAKYDFSNPHGWVEKEVLKREAMIKEIEDKMKSK